MEEFEINLNIKATRQEDFDKIYDKLQQIALKLDDGDKVTFTLYGHKPYFKEIN